MKKGPKEIDWSTQKPGTTGVTRSGSKVEFVAHREGTTCFYHCKSEWLLRFANGRLYKDREDLMDVLFPWESCTAEGHNPDKLTNEQVGDGWRLLTIGEDIPEAAQLWSSNESRWVNSRCGWKVSQFPSCTHRVPIAKPKRRVPCGPEHFPPGTVVRTKDRRHWQAVLWARPSGLGGMGADLHGTESDYESLMNGVERSTDGGKTWLPCYVEVEE